MSDRDCLHGRQVGKCADCDVERLEAENEALRARVEVAEAGFHSAVSKAQWQATTNAELNRLSAHRFALQELNAELVEALKLARSIIGHPDDAHTQMIDAAIAKATGEQT